MEATGRRRAPAGTVAIALLALVAAGANAAPVSPPVAVRARIVPPSARLGERVRYEGRAVFEGGSDAVRWLTPEPDSNLTWGAPIVRRGRAAGAHRGDTLFVEIPLQAFRLGVVSVPGLRFQHQDPADPRMWRLPVATLTVTSVLSAADSNADLRPLRGPLGAPWWERVPWAWVIGALVALALAILAIVAWRRRRKLAALPAVVEDPVTAALRRLEELRARRLPESGRFPDHAFELTAILRRYLEATASSPRPGDTTSELVRRFEQLPLTPDERRRLGELLSVWDRVKFAREPLTVTAAHGLEREVDAFLRQRAAPPQERAA